jgi:hypothetical protein
MKTRIALLSHLSVFKSSRLSILQSSLLSVLLPRRGRLFLELVTGQQ